MIPPEASVAATDPETPHISNRVTAHPFRTGSGTSDYLLMRRLVRKDSRRNAQRAINNSSYGLLAHVGDFYLFKKNHESPETADALKRLGLKPGGQNE